MRLTRSVRRALRRLSEIKRPLYRELAVLGAQEGYLGGEPAHVCCERPRNLMRITPLEGVAIAVAFDEQPDLRAALPRVLTRTVKELRRLEDSEERQPYDCPLLEEGRCLVHRAAKPVGCLAWNPPPPGETSRDSSYTPAGWQALAERDALDRQVDGSDSTKRLIPLALKRVFASELEGLRSEA